METRISTKGQVVLPSRIRRALGLEPGDTLQAEIDGSDIRLTPKKRRRLRARIIQDPVTGLPVLSAGPNAPTLTHAQIREMLADFP